MQVYSQNHTMLCLLQHYTKLAITKKLENGDKTLSFQCPHNEPTVKFLQNEVYIATKEDEYVLKEIGTSKQYMKYTARLNLEELEGKRYTSFVTKEQTIRECLTVALAGTGWTIGVCDVTKKRTIKKDDTCTVLDIIEQIISTYKVEVEYHTKTKVVDICEQMGDDKGVYFMEAVNLRQIPSYTIKTTELYTQIKPIGKDGVTIDVDGKDYLEDYTYSSKRLMYIWKDERYTNPASLEEDARLKLEEMSRPVVTYEADVIDLAKTSEEYKNLLSYRLGDTITLVSKTRNIREKMRIVEITEYPYSPQNNTCQLSTAKKTFSSVLQETKNEAVSEATAIAATNTSENIDKESDITTDEIQLAIEGAKTEILKDVSDTYLSKAEATNIATTAAQTATEETKQHTDKKLEDYATEQKLTEEVVAAKKDVLLTVGQNYVTKEAMSTTQQQLNQEMMQLQEAIEEQFDEQNQAIEDALLEMEKTKNDIVATDGSIWRMGIDVTKGCLFFEKLEE